jgi:hypothetical protein
MPDKAFVEITAYWGNGDAEGTIKLRSPTWEQIKVGASFQKSSWSYYEGEHCEVVWSFAGGKVTIDGEDGMQCVVSLPVEELIVRPEGSEGET